jgi:predicted mannosyl-3-phosphoglycerate phosphatase (HAD superfamily)
MKIYLDFDGTVVEHAFPILGRANENALNVINALQKAGHTIILNTYRADIDFIYLKESIDYLNTRLDNQILHYLPKKVHPEKFNMDKAISSDILYIDDISEDIPMKKTVDIKNGYMVDWVILEEIFKMYKIIY